MAAEVDHTIVKLMPNTLLLTVVENERGIVDNAKLAMGKCAREVIAEEMPLLILIEGVLPVLYHTCPRHRNTNDPASCAVFDAT